MSSKSYSGVPEREPGLEVSENRTVIGHVVHDLGSVREAVWLHHRLSIYKNKNPEVFTAGPIFTLESLRGHISINEKSIR